MAYIFSSQERVELSLRWQRVQKIMEESGVEALIVSDNTSLCYLAGQIFAGAIYITLGRDPLFFVRRPVGLEGDDVVYIRKVEQIPALLAERGYPVPRRVALEGDVLSFNEYDRLSKIFGEGTVATSEATSILRRARSVKTEMEIEAIRASGVKHAELYKMVPSLFVRGMSDQDLAIELEYQARRLGSLGSMRIFGRTMEVFVGSILCGDNATAPSPYDFALGGAGVDGSLPVGYNGTVIEDGMCVMVDQGGNFGRYMTDMTRVFSVGDIAPLAQRAHDTALEMQRRMMEMVKIGSATADVYNMCLDLAREESLAEYFMGYSQQAGFVGHGIGLEVNEVPVLAPRSREIFEERTTFAFEPKFTLPNIGAVGVENTFVVRESGVEKLTLCEEAIIPIG